jgi:hypothetical protein
MMFIKMPVAQHVAQHVALVVQNVALIEQHGAQLVANEGVNQRL